MLQPSAAVRRTTFAFQANKLDRIQILLCFRKDFRDSAAGAQREKLRIRGIYSQLYAQQDKQLGLLALRGKVAFVCKAVGYRV